MENWEKRIPAGICNSLTDYYESFRRLEKLETEGAKILPSHDFVVFDWFQTVESEKIGTGGKKDDV